MFAARFVPGTVESAANKKNVEGSVPKKVLPLKRSRETVKKDNDDEESTDDESGGEESNIAMDGYKQGKELSEQDSIAKNTTENKFNNQNIDTAINSNSAINNTEDSLDSKHSSVLSRFKQTLTIQDELQKKKEITNLGEESNIEQGIEEDSNVVLHDLAPIPQPAKVYSNTHDSAASLKLDTSTAWSHTTKIIYDNEMIKPWEDLPLSELLIKNVKNNFSSEKAFPIQTSLITTVLPLLKFNYNINKRLYPQRTGDILVNASTGSGKTLAYALPIIEILKKRTINRTRCVVIVPTKMLIHQVFETFNKLTQGTSLVLTTTKLEMSLKEEISKFEKQQPDILIITPGRLVDHINSGSITLQDLKFLVLDEADRLLNQSFQNWCDLVMNDLKKHDKLNNVIKMVFSATLTTNTEKLHHLNLNTTNTKLFIMDSIKLYHIPASLQEHNIKISSSKNAERIFKVLVFVKSNESSIRLAPLVQALWKENESKISSINSNNTKQENKVIMGKFSESQQFDSYTDISVLISTDIMSRGIDINDITHVVNYDVPISSQQYVHRSGRTARALKSGDVYNLLVGKGEYNFWKNQIDIDLSRDVGGCEVVEEDATGNSEVALSENHYLNLSASEIADYKKCLQSFSSS
ncbi:hypothetical protein ACO0QE_000830 [Hanseniaspora vineae]